MQHSEQNRGDMEQDVKILIKNIDESEEENYSKCFDHKKGKNKLCKKSNHQIDQIMSSSSVISTHKEHKSKKLCLRQS